MYYKIVKAFTIEELEKLVNDLLEDDWELQGGVCVRFTYYAHNDAFYQALIKQESGMRLC